MHAKQTLITKIDSHFSHVPKNCYCLVASLFCFLNCHASIILHMESACVMHFSVDWHSFRPKLQTKLREWCCDGTGVEGGHCDSTGVRSLAEIAGAIHVWVTWECLCSSTSSPRNMHIHSKWISNIKGEPVCSARRWTTISRSYMSVYSLTLSILASLSVEAAEASPTAKMVHKECEIKTINGIIELCNYTTNFLKVDVPSNNCFHLCSQMSKHIIHLLTHSSGVVTWDAFL